jgi:hypothetical protein
VLHEPPLLAPLELLPLPPEPLPEPLPLPAPLDPAPDDDPPVET